MSQLGDFFGREKRGGLRGGGGGGGGGGGTIEEVAETQMDACIFFTTLFEIS